MDTAIGNIISLRNPKTFGWQNSICLQLCYYLALFWSLNVYGLFEVIPLNLYSYTLPHITPYHHLPNGISLSFLICPSLSVLNGLHSLSLIGECKFCHHLINVQVSAHAGSSAPVGTSVRAHPCSHRGVRRRKTHAHTYIRPYAHARYCHFGY